MADEYKNLTDEKSDSTASKYGGVIKRGLAESIPFYGEKIAESAELPKPESLGQRFTKRVATNLPWNAPIMVANPLLGTATLAGSSIFGQAAEELGGGTLTQMGAEILGGGIPSFGRSVLGKMVGHKIPELEELVKKAKADDYEVGAAAKSRKGMAYGAGDDPEKLERNLTKATQKATERTGNKTDSIDSNWLNTTQTKLGSEVSRIFGNKVFKTDFQDSASITKVLNEAQSAFGDQGNVVKSIIESNIKGNRPGGKIIDEIKGSGFIIPINSTFNADDLRKAIIDVNARLGSGTNPNQNRLLYELKTSLENIAQRNLIKIDKQLAEDYSKWKADYTAYATLRDLYSKAGESGIAIGGKVNPRALLDIIVQRTGNPAYVQNNPLYKNIAEYGDILSAPKASTKMGKSAVLSALGETTPSKALSSFLQPGILTPKEEMFKKIGIYGTPTSQIQLDSSKTQKDPYEGLKIKE